MSVTLTFFLLPNVSYAGLVEAALVQQALSDLNEVIKSVRPYNRDAAKRLNIIRLGLKAVITKDKGLCDKPKKSFADLILSRASDISKNRCEDEETSRITDENQETITFTPRFEHCLSSADLKCVCSHAQHKDDPQCAPYVNKGKGSREQKCIPNDVADNAFTILNQVIDNLDTAFAADSDGNGTSDICEDNL